MLIQTPSLLLLMLANAAPSFASVHHPAILKVSNEDWNTLNASVEGRLGVLRPLAETCYLKYDAHGQTQFHNPDLEACHIAQKKRRNVDFITSQPAAYHDAFYGSCMTAGHGCPLTNFPANDTTNPLPGTCFQGSVPDYYIDARKVLDIQAGLKFAEKHGIPLVIKNTGHDYKGRSAGRHSLAIWTHNLQPPIHLDEDFKPDGCGKPVGSTLTYGAGQGFEGIYEFAHQHGYMAIGGACPTVGASGGYITGGGHSLLSPVHGLGVDNVMQMKVVLPNGTYATANRCQNQEIFFALRGGGGASFGVVTETTARVFPEVPLQMAVISFASSLTSREVTSLVVENGVKLAENGWGGYMSSLGDSTSLMLAITPKLTHEEAKLSMKPLTDFALPRNNGSLRFGVDVTTVENYWEFLQSPAFQFISGLIDGISVAQSSRLVLKENFGTESKRQELTDVLSNMPFGINMVAPHGYELPKSDQPGGPGEASVTPAWREAVWHIMLQSTWDTDGQSSHTPEFFAERFKEASEVVDPLRQITPNSGAYQNEADVYEPNHIESFWGRKNYDRLLKIKKDVDPSNLITCHQCVGADSDDSRLSCYPQI